jgi:peptidoglycan hydrolase-like protein with peptidoglycan-binding domain
MSLRVRAATAAVVLVAVAALGACAAGDESDLGSPDPASEGPQTAEPSTTSTTPPASPSTSAAPTTTSTLPPPPPPDVLREGMEGPDVLALQQALAFLGFRPGEPDGRYGSATTSAVLAFQKWAGLQRDGVAGPQTEAALAAPPPAPGRRDTGPGPRIEIDLDRQIMFVTLADGTVSILNVSSGNNETYVHPAGYTARAVTPTGAYTVLRKIDAEERAPLGTLYRPMYFKGGFAVHGSTSVPGYPASHGCVRVSYADEDWLFPQMPVGAPVLVYSGVDQGEAGTDTPIA